MTKFEELINLLKEIRKVDDIEIKDYAIDSLIERLEDQAANIKKDPVDKKNI